MSHLPPMVPLHEVAAELRKATHVLVSAAGRGEFAPVQRIGAVWYVRKDRLDEWFSRNHAEPCVTPAQKRRVRRAGRSEVAAQPSPLPLQPRAHTASSS